ncbi:MAG: hypothetical protein OHK0040_10170 [bacterium]
MRSTLKDVYWFHGHTCPMSTLGFRAGQLAKKLLKLKRKDYRVALAKLYFRSCAIDGVQLAFPVTYGNGNLLVFDEKDMKFEFIRTDLNKRVLLTFTEKLKKMMEKYLSLRQEAEKSNNNTVQKEMKLAYSAFLKFTQNTKEEDIFVVEQYD